jgi:soluble P-type ATPase
VSSCAQGVLIKGSRALELLGKLSAASFDKSGTLTEGHFQLNKVHTFGPYSRQQALQLAAMLEQHSNHPIAHAIVGAAAASGCMSSGGAEGAQHVTEIAGKGLQGHVGGQDVAVGSWGFAQELLPAARKPGVELQPAERDMQLAQDADAAVLAEAKHLLSSADAAGSTVVCLVVEHQLAALLLLSDRARSNALAAVQQLQLLGVQCLMMTGDTMGAAAHVAGQLGIEPDDVCAELLPQEKLELIGTLRHRLAAGRQRKQAGSTVQRISSWCSQLLRRRGSGGGTGSYCSGCEELAGDCSCSIALGPESSSMHRSGSGGFKGTSSSGMRIDALPRLAGSSSSAKATQGVIIAHVGDGINDAPALAGADVGVAMGVAGAALAVDAADVALFSNDLTSLPFVVRLGRRASWVVAANTIFACSIKVAVLAAAAGGVASLWLSLLADVGSSLLVTLHALTLLRFEAGQAHPSSRSTLYTSRLSGIPLAAGELGGEGGPAAAQHPAGGAVGRGSMAATAVGGLQRLQQLLARLPGLSWLRPYDKLEDCTPAMSAGVSRLNSSNTRGLGSFLLGGGGGVGGGAVSGGHCVLTPKGSAAQELREMAILACAVPSTTAALLGGSDDGRGPGAGGSGGVFVIDDECC